MYRILIIEDEKPAAKHICKLVISLDDKIEIVDTIDSVEDSVAWLRNFSMPDLIFMDIQLADGLSFDIFEKVKITCPVIFTTAYDEYALKAFEVNSIDYLLKPIEKKSLLRSWEKFQTLKGKNIDDISALISTIRSKDQKAYRERFLVKKGDGFKYINVSEAAYFFSDEGLSFIKLHEGSKYIIDEKLDKLESSLNPKLFYRINRKLIIN